MARQISQHSKLKKEQRFSVQEKLKQNNKIHFLKQSLSEDFKESKDSEMLNKEEKIKRLLFPKYTTKDESNNNISKHSENIFQNNFNKNKINHQNRYRGFTFGLNQDPKMKHRKNNKVISL